MVTFYSKAELFFFYRHKQLQVQAMFFKIQTIEQNPRFQNSGDLKRMKVYQGDYTSEHDSVVMVRYQNTQQSHPRG